MESATVALGHAEEHEHHGPPEANESSRIDKQTLGILLFIVSEIMLFGAFFASYFFLRVVVAPPSWPPHPYELPVAVAGVNTAILVSSSFTIHYALEAIRRGNRAGMSEGVIAAAPDWSLEHAAAEMSRRGVRHLVVFEGPELVGILSMRDIVRVWTSDGATSEMTLPQS